MQSPYVDFPVIGTIDLGGTSDIRRAVDLLVNAYANQGPEGKFSYRILLPREQKSTAKAKRIGIAFQGEFILGLRKRNILPKIRELRYVHGESHYGWLLASPEVFENFERSTKNI